MKTFKSVSLLILIVLQMFCVSAASASQREKYNFNSKWLLHVGDDPTFEMGEDECDFTLLAYDDVAWKKVSLPHAFNEDEAFRLDIHELTDTVMWYRKHFSLPLSAKGRKVFLEFEGARQGVDCYVNGRLVGIHENGAMAFGFDITDYVKVGTENIIAVRVDNDWNYRERATRQKYQWDDKNFNANYGGLTKNVWLHVTDRVYQTLPLYSNLGTTGTYVYASEMNVRKRSAVVNVESQVRNDSYKSVRERLKVEVIDADGKVVASFSGDSKLISAGTTETLSASCRVNGLHFWSWGYGYLYTVRCSLSSSDVVDIRTGFRKTRFADGKVWLNDRVIQLKGFAQRTSNEWPAVGMSVPAWMSDYSNDLMVKANANLVRWMHITPWKQDVESCDRVGLIQAMPAGDAEKDVEGQRWVQRTQLMRDAIIYNRNNPSILFYESGNESISREHMIEMRALRDSFDYFGGRAIGSREMLDIREAEYGGEMLYINKSAHSPMWAMEYCRDEALRKYWDDWSYPYHLEGEGNKDYLSAMTGKKSNQKDTSAYNHNQDQFVVENVHRWWDYFIERPGGGRRSSSGGAKIIFSDTNTHFRGAENYRRSGDVDPMRIPKDVYYAHQVMWDGWVDIENPRIDIVGHWNYDECIAKNGDTLTIVKPVYVVANTDSVALFLNGEALPELTQRWQFLFTADSVEFEPGQLVAVGYNEGKAVCADTLQTAGKPHHIKLSSIKNPLGWKADGADMALVQVEVVDEEGRRCPLANDTIHFELNGPAEYRGGLAQGRDNFILRRDLPVECGVNRVILRSTTQDGVVTLTATPSHPSPEKELKGDVAVFCTVPIDEKNGLSTYNPSMELKGRLDRGETPSDPSYTERAVDVEIVDAHAGCNQKDAVKSYDDNELSEWKNDGRLSTAWITYDLARMAQIDDVCIKLTGWRLRSYPLEIFADDELVWSGDTERSLGYVHLKVKPRMARHITIRLKGTAQDRDEFGQITEVTAPAAGELDLFKAKGGENVKSELRIVEVEFKETF